jgi:hypothetical protein
MIDLRLPSIKGNTPDEKIAELERYIRYLVNELQFALNQKDSERK